MIPLPEAPQPAFVFKVTTRTFPQLLGPNSIVDSVSARTHKAMAPSTALPFYNPLDPTHPKLWPSYRLLMPVCAVGNVGQLACDLVISTLLSKKECQLVGRIYSPALMAVVGPNAFFPQGPATTSTEVYESKKHKLVILQQRTSYFKNLKHLYIEDLVQWIKGAQFDSVFVLTSSFAQCNPDTSQLGLGNTSHVQCITTSLFEPSKSWLEINMQTIPQKQSIKVVQDGLTFLPGSGITKSFIKACEAAFIPAAFIVDFCSEGINIFDCYEVVNIVDRLLNLNCANQSPEKNDQEGSKVLNGWVEPLSWMQDHRE